MTKSRVIMFLSMFNFINFLGYAQQDKDSTMTVQDLKKLMKDDSTLVILDVRTPAELVGPLGKIDNVINIPIQELESRIGELKKYKDKEIAVICRSGNRSNIGTKILRENGFNANNVLGGIIEFRNQ
ncbi:MAG TPA: rhodanese-like domain-containing protein [Ignavibacteriaceae bacterium]